MRPGRLLFVILMSVILGGLPLTVWGQSWGEVTPGEWTLPPPLEFPEANAVILFDEATVLVETIDGRWWQPRFTTERHIRFLAHNRAGVDEIGEFQIGFHKDANIDEFAAQTIRPDGTIVPVAEEGIFIKKIGDSRYRTLAFPMLDSGCIAEVRYKTVRNSYLSYYPFEFHSGLFTELSRFTMILGCRCQYRYTARNMLSGRTRPVEGIKPGVDPNQPYKTFSWALRDLMPIVEEPFMTCVDDYRSQVVVRLSGFSQEWKEYEWNQMGKVFEHNVKDYITLPRDFRKTIKTVTKGCKSDYDKSKALYDYVVHEFETRQSGYRMTQHHGNMNGLWNERFGTGWEKNLLLFEMLRKARIKCWPILICTRDHARFDPTNKDFDQFSHMLVFTEVEQGGIYLDASSPYCLYGTLPPVCKVDLGLLIDGLNSELLKVVTNEPRSVRTDQMNLHIDSAGNAEGTATCLMTGYLSSEYGMLFESKEPELFYREDILANLPGSPEIVSSSCEFDSAGRLNIEVDFRIDHCADILGSSVVARAPDPMFGENPFASERRWTPVDFNYPFSYYNMTMLSGDGVVAPGEMPEPVAIGIEGITFQRQAEGGPDGVRVQSVLQVKQPTYTIDQYPLVREFFNRVATADDASIVWDGE